MSKINIIEGLQKRKSLQKNIRIIRPGFGIQPVYLEKLLNKKSPYDIRREISLKNSVLKKLKIFI
jgi:sialic acid synthase SpsE